MTLENDRTRRTSIATRPLRHLWIAFAIGFALLVWGFWPSTFGQSQPLGALRIIHGTLATLWMALLVAQSWLAGRWRIRQHRIFGWASVAIVPALVVSALFVVADMLRHSTYFPRELRLTLAWGDFVSLILFSLLWALAIANRRRWPLHARYAGCTLFAAIPPALGRIYGGPMFFDSLPGALHPAYITCEVVVAALLVRDLVKGGHPMPYLITLAGTLFLEWTMFPAAHWPWYIALANAIGPLG